VVRERKGGFAAFSLPPTKYFEFPDTELVEVSSKYKFADRIILASELRYSSFGVRYSILFK
jgi:hypothetical protein